ncbi:MAG TPA: hypothetical protein VEA63_10630 [Opitutus sp.]|nr:hypothetical protein [Opitutus sp.]
MSTNTSLLHRTLVFGALVLAALPASAAVTWKNIQLGGFASQGYLINTGHNDYLGDTSEGTFDFREYAVNASWSKGKFRAGGQAFAQKLGEYGEDKVSLDWGIVDYQATQWFGLRAGRVKMPRGLYNEALDVDSVRPFVLLPQSVYDARLRGFNAAFNGAMVYGNVSLRNLGSVDYKLFYGDIPMSTSSGANDYFNNDAPFPNASIGMDAVYGGSLFWNTPVSGLRAGYSYSAFQDFGADRIVSFVIPGVPPMEFIMYRATDLYERHLLSAEYTTGDWIFATEIGRETAFFGIGFPATAPIGFFDIENLYGYLSVARRLNSRVEVGAYYSYSKEKQLSVGIENGQIFPDAIQHDFAVSAKFDITDHLIAKLEGHYLDGAGKLFDTATKPQPFARRDDSWFMLAAKVTYSF